jgi:plastocyanin
MLVAVLLGFLVQLVSSATYTVYLGMDITTGTKAGWTLMQFFPPDLSIAQGDSIEFQTHGYGHLLLFAPGPQNFFDGATLTYIPPTYEGPLTVNDPVGVFSGGPTYPGDRVTFNFPVLGEFHAFCGYHPQMKFRVTVDAVALQTPAAVDANRTAIIAAATAAVPTYSVTGTAPSVQNSDGTRTWTVTVGHSNAVPLAAFMRFIPMTGLVITVGDSITFVDDNHVDQRALAINSTNTWQESVPLVGGTVIETTSTPGGRIMEQPFYLIKTGDNTNYHTGWITSGWIGSADFPDVPGFGKLASTWTVTFKSAGTFYLRDTIAGACPTWTGPECTGLFKTTITVKAAPAPDPTPSPNPDPNPYPHYNGANAVILSAWAVLAVFLAYF